MRIEVWTANIFADELLGEADVSLLPMMRYTRGGDGSGSEAVRHTVPLTLSSKTGDPTAARVPAGSIEMAFVFTPAHIGMLVLTTHDGRNLRNMDMIGEQDPYVVAEVGKQRAQGTTAVNGGLNPTFRDEDLVLWIGPSEWSNDLHVSCFDEDIGRDDLIGATTIPLMPLMQSKSESAPARAKLDVALTSGKTPAGTLHITSQFYRAGDLTIEVVEGRKLKGSDVVGEIDPYVKVSLEGGEQTLEGQTSAIPEGGAMPEWNEALHFNVVD